MAEAMHSQPYPDAASFDSKTFTDILMNKLIEGGVAKALTQLGLQVPSGLKASSKT